MKQNEMGFIKNEKELEFVIFCIENLAKRLDVSPETVYHALTQKSDLLNRYIVPEYEMLHTQDKDYILDDILFVMKKEGVKL